MELKSSKGAMNGLVRFEPSADIFDKQQGDRLSEIACFILFFYVMLCWSLGAMSHYTRCHELLSLDTY